MRDHDLDHDPAASKRERPREARGDAHLAVSRAIEGGRPDTLGPAGLLHLQRAAGNAGVGALVQREPDESPVKEVVGSSGAPLDTDTRSFMEQRLGHDFASVRVHTDARAGASARSVQAHAYTVGENVVFGEGRYAPQSDEGRRTLAHELTHVVQQRSGPVDGTPSAGGISLSNPSDRFEREAESTADRVMSTSEPVAATASAPATTGATAQRDAEQDTEVQGLFVQRQGADPAKEEEEAPA